MKSTLIFLLSFLSLLSSAQTGTLRGTVIDDKSGETIIAANVLVINQNIGAGTDMDGKFSIEITAGTYDIEISYMGYNSKIVEGVVIKAGEVTVLGPVAIKELEFGNDMDAAIIRVKANKASETALLTLKLKTPVIMDGISSAKMDLIGDGTAVEAAKRVTGVSVEGGKYVYVRGLGDRYTKTTMNSVEIPGLDPDKNTLQMDIFPTSLIDKITVTKNFTADLPADFTGGLLNIETKDFPDKKIFDVSVGTSYNPNMHFNKDFLTYKGGKTDFLGFDDGTRALPAGADAQNIPTPVSGASSQEVNSFVRSFNPQLGAQKQTSLMDLSLSLTLGNQFSLGKDSTKKDKPTLGYIFSVAYKTDYKYYDDVVYGEYQKSVASDENGLNLATQQNGAMGERNILIGMLGGVALKTQYSKFRLSVMRLQSGESRAGIFNIYNNSAAIGQSGYIATSHNLEYNERALTNILLHGTHLSKKPGLEMNWRISPTISSSQDPDIRKTAFTYTNIDTGFNAGAGGNPTRIWRSLNEFSTTFKFDVSKDYKIIGRPSNLKFGASHLYKQRNYEIKFFDIQFFGRQDWVSPDPNTVLNEENIFPSKINNIYYQSGNNVPNPNQYNSSVNNTGLYVSNEFQISTKWKAIAGLRAENFVQRHTGRDQRYASGDVLNGNNLDNEKVLESLDFFPSINIIHNYTEKGNLRLTYGKTIARPSFKELSYAQIIDPITNRIFNGSLFTYSNWDGNLVQTDVNNIDLRWELYLQRNQMFSVSGFYKTFKNPIELVRIPEQQTSTEYQPRNVGDGKLFGVEIEVQKNFDFISEAFSKFSFSGNVTLVESQINMTLTEFQSRKNFEKPGQTVDRIRQMAGQAPYVINGGISYNDYEKGLNAGIFYNVKGPTLYIVGGGLFPDIYNKPFNSLNFSVNRKLGKDKLTQIDFKVANILNDRLESYYKADGTDTKPFTSFNPGRSFSFGLKHSF